MLKARNRKSNQGQTPILLPDLDVSANDTPVNVALNIAQKLNEPKSELIGMAVLASSGALLLLTILKKNKLILTLAILEKEQNCTKKSTCYVSHICDLPMAYLEEFFFFYYLC